MDYQQNQQIESHLQETDSSKSDVQVQQLSLILEESRKLTLSFIQELKEKALTPISQEVLDHYHDQMKSNYSVKDVITIIDKRISKMIRNKKIKKNWNSDDIVLLLWFVSKYISLKQDLTCQTLKLQDWKYLSNLIPGSSSKGCMFKFISLKKVKLSVFNWSKEEQDKLRTLVLKLGQNKWKQISQILYENNPDLKIYRTPKQCRQHWNCYLDPKLKKGPWSEVQDVKLLQNVNSNKGERKWSSIKRFFEGRTQNALKNRYNLLLERQKKLSPNKNESQLIRDFLKTKGSSQTSIEISPDQIQDSHKLQGKAIPSHQQIYQQPVEDSKNKGSTSIEVQEQRNQPLLIKSDKSSFRVSQAYRKNLAQNQLLQKNQLKSQQNLVNNFILFNIGEIPSIITNDQGFYTNFLYKPFYGN